MRTYLTVFRYARDSWRAMVRAPEDRSAAARTVVEAAGGHLEAFYWMLGDDDGLVIFTAPDPEAAAAVTAAISASGRVSRMRTTQLLTSDEARTALERARVVSAAYEPPGGQPDWRADYDEGVTVA